MSYVRLNGSVRYMADILLNSADPDLADRENNPIDKETFDGLLWRARKLLKVRTDQYDDSVRHQVVKDVLSKGLGADKIINTPLAVKRSEKYGGDIFDWSGADTILGELKFVPSKDTKARVKYRLLTEALVMGVAHYDDERSRDPELINNVWALDVGSARDINDPAGTRFWNITARRVRDLIAASYCRYLF